MKFAGIACDFGSLISFTLQFIMKKFLPVLLSVLALTFATSVASAAHHEGGHDKKMMMSAPSTVIHVVTVSWKEDATQEGIDAALAGVHQLVKDFDGIKRVWTKTLKAQGNRSHAFVMEFASAQALEDYAGSDAQKKWYESYYKVRAGSTTFDITN